MAFGNGIVLEMYIIEIKLLAKVRTPLNRLALMLANQQDISEIKHTTPKRPAEISPYGF